MRISDLKFTSEMRENAWRGHRVEMPKTDAQRCVSSPEAAAKHITTCWDDLDSWWGSENVQNARKVFCDKYSKRVNSPILTLKKLLLDNL